MPKRKELDLTSLTTPTKKSEYCVMDGRMYEARYAMHFDHVWQSAKVNRQLACNYRSNGVKQGTSTHLCSYSLLLFICVCISTYTCAYCTCGPWAKKQKHSFLPKIWLPPQSGKPEWPGIDPNEVSVCFCLPCQLVATTELLATSKYIVRHFSEVGQSRASRLHEKVLLHHCQCWKSICFP